MTVKHYHEHEAEGIEESVGKYGGDFELGTFLAISLPIIGILIYIIHKQYGG
jgi:hypothetical protein